MKPHEVRPNGKKEKKNKMQNEMGAYLILRLRGLVRNKGTCPISRCKKEKKQAQNGRPQRTLSRSVCAVCVRSVCAANGFYHPRTPGLLLQKHIVFTRGSLPRRKQERGTL